MKRIFPLFFLSSCIGAGDMFARREKIVGHYYLVYSEASGSDEIAYKTSYGYTGRSTPNEKLIAYANSDSLLVMKMQKYDSTVRYFVIDMRKDSDTAKNKEVFIDTLSLETFSNSWIDKLALSFQKVP